MKEKDKYFDHIIGEQNHKSSLEDIKMLKRIIKAHSEDYTEDEKMNFQRIGLHLTMKRYLAEPIKQIKPVGEFLNELLEIYKVKKTKFAELIDYENTNLHAVLKGRRRLNNKLATKIGSIFSIDPQLWMYIDAKNELAKYQKENVISKSKYTLAKLKYAR
jgi:plasmid maintenance system antidote protein VapI